MPSHILESEIYGHNWCSDEMRALLDEKAKIASWLLILRELAQAQAELKLIPEADARNIGEFAKIENVNFQEFTNAYRSTGHSMIGLIQSLKKDDRTLPNFFFGATVQDITDNWTALTLKKSWDFFFRDLRKIEERLILISGRHSRTALSGRTHGQVGSPLSFGYKTAAWALEIRRHIERFKQLRPRILSGQLGGGTGSLPGYGALGIKLRKIFFDRLGLTDTGIAWTNSRDQITEFAQNLVLVAATLEKIGNEVYNLQRPEIGELREALPALGISSITMPHKQNPELSEHLGTLARLIRHQTGALQESLVHEHERDGKSWKLEWAVLPEILANASAALELGLSLVMTFTVDSQRMRENLAAQNGYDLSEGLSLKLAKDGSLEEIRANMQRVCRNGLAQKLSLEDALAADSFFKPHLEKIKEINVFEPDHYLDFCHLAVQNTVSAWAALKSADELFLGTHQ